MDEAERGRRRPAGRSVRRRRSRRAMAAAAVPASAVLGFVLAACAVLGFVPRAEATIKPPPVTSMACSNSWEKVFAQIDGLNIKRTTLKAHPEIVQLLPDPELQPSTLFAVSDRAYVNLLSDPGAQVTAELDNFEARMPLGKAASMWLFRAMPAPYSAEELRGLRSAPTALAFATAQGKYALGFQPIHIAGIDNVLIDDLLATVQATPVIASYKVCSSWLHVIEQYLVPASSFNVSKIPDPVPGGRYSADQEAEVPQPLPTSLELFNERTRAQMPKPWEWRKKAVIGGVLGGLAALALLSVAAFFAVRHARRARDRSLEDGRKAGIELGLAEASRALSHGIPLTGGLSGGLQLPGSTLSPHHRGGNNNANGNNVHNHGSGSLRQGNHYGNGGNGGNGGGGGSGGLFGGKPLRSPRLSGSSAVSGSGSSASAAAAAPARAAAAPGSENASNTNSGSGSGRRGARLLRLIRHSYWVDRRGSGGASGFSNALPTIRGSGHSEGGGNPYEISDFDDDGHGHGGAQLQQRGSGGGPAAAAAAAAAAGPVPPSAPTTTTSPEALFPDLSSLGTGWEIDGSAVRVLTDPATGLPRKLGEGGFGSVFLAEMDGATPVAVKIVGNQQPREVRRFVQEVSILKSLRHTNVVQFLGAFFSADRVALLTEFLPRGDLHRLLGRDTGGQLGWYRRGRAIALDVVRGIVYMHSRKPPVAHLDLKPANCLLGRDWTCKIADVGLSKVLSREDTQVSLEGTFEWAAPEVLSGERVCEKADLFALSVILYEIVTGEAPRNRQLREIRCPEECPEAVRDVIERCHLRDPALRPTAKEVYDILSATPPTGMHHPMGGSTAMFPPSMASQASSALQGAGGSGSGGGNGGGGVGSVGGSVFGSIGSVAAGGGPFGSWGAGGSILGAGGGRGSGGSWGDPAAATAAAGAGAALREAQSSGSAAAEAAASAAGGGGSGSGRGSGSGGGGSVIGGGGGASAQRLPLTPFASSSQAAPAAAVPVPVPRRVPVRLPPSAFSSTPSS